MTSLRTGVRLGALLALAACGWMAADGLRRAGAEVTRARVPWDADRLPEEASEAAILALRPVSPFARFRDALARAPGADGDAFRRAARGVLRWGRNQPGTLLHLGEVALARWQRMGEGGDREVGEALLVEFARRTTNGESRGLSVWLPLAPPGADPFETFRDVPAEAWPSFGHLLVASHPDAAWRFLEPQLLDGRLNGGVYAADVLALARARRRPSDVAMLERFARREDVTASMAAALRELASELKPGP